MILTIYKQKKQRPAPAAKQSSSAERKNSHTASKLNNASSTLAEGILIATTDQMVARMLMA
jgi:hypothetical protein